MKRKPRILLTGSTGFIGQAILKNLQTEGYEVWSISRFENDDPFSIRCDLGDASSINKALSTIPECRVVIHAAYSATATGRTKNSPGASTEFSKNLFRALEKKQPHLIHISSVAIYGDGRYRRPVTVRDIPLPINNYGRDKLSAERALQESGINNYHILRVAPVYSETHLRNLAVRVYLPFIPIRIRPVPSPRFSLCHIDTLTLRILELVHKGPSGPMTSNVSDRVPHSQSDLLPHFSGPALTLPVILTSPVYYLSYLLPHTVGRRLRGLYWKFFKDNIFL